MQRELCKFNNNEHNLQTNETQFLNTLHSDNGCIQIPNGTPRTLSQTINNENPPDPSPQSNSSTPLLMNSIKQNVKIKRSSSLTELNGNINSANTQDDSDEETVNFDIYLNGQQEATFL